jgi:hypothetical protein
VKITCGDMILVLSEEAFISWSKKWFPNQGRHWFPEVAGKVCYAIVRRLFFRQLLGTASGAQSRNTNWFPNHVLGHSRATAWSKRDTSVARSVSNVHGRCINGLQAPLTNHSIVSTCVSLKHAIMNVFIVMAHMPNGCIRPSK